MPYSRRHFLAAAVSMPPVLHAKTHSMPPGWTLSPSGTGKMPVWSFGSGPGVLLMHEIFGLSPTDIACGESIAKAGPFQVFMPLLFGKPKREQKLTGPFRSCGSAGFDCSHAVVHQPILDLLHPLTERIASESRGNIGAIGMCLTGAFPLALLRNPRVVAPILAQPSLPIPGSRQGNGIGLTVDDILVAVRRDIPILGLRYRQNKICTDIQFKNLALPLTRK